METVKGIIAKHTEKLNNIKDNLSRWEEEQWSDAEMKDAENQIRVLASILSDLNRSLNGNNDIVIPTVSHTDSQVLVFIPLNETIVENGYYNNNGLVKMLRKYKGNPDAIHFIADMLV